MRCNRCGYAVPEWLWLGDDHPLIVEQKPVQFTRTDNLDADTVKITAESVVKIGMCSDYHKRQPSDFIDIGPECFTDKEQLVISYKGENYYKACGKLVKGSLAGDATTCVKRVNHKYECEDYDGNQRD